MAGDAPKWFFQHWQKRGKKVSWVAMAPAEQARAEGFFADPSFPIGSKTRYQNGDWLMLWIKDSETRGRQLNTTTKTARWIQAHPKGDTPPPKPDPWDEDEEDETEATSADAVTDPLDQGSATAARIPSTPPLPTLSAIADLPRGVEENPLGIPDTSEYNPNTRRRLNVPMDSPPGLQPPAAHAEQHSETRNDYREITTPPREPGPPDDVCIA